MTSLHAWSSDHFHFPLPATHTFPVAKYGRVRETLLAENVLDPECVHRSEPAPVEWLARVHDADYLERLLAGRLTPDEVRRIGLPWSPELVVRARAATGGTVRAAFRALEAGLSGNLAGGTHHAFRDRGEGYCLVNDVAVAVALLRAEGHARRPFLLDLDVHQGNGTAALFAHDPSVYTFSMHGARNYPLRKERSTLDLELADGTTDAEFLALLDAHLEPALEDHAPDIVFYQAGVDGHEADRLGRLALTFDGLMARDRRVFEACEARALPVVVTLGGGYGRPIEATIRAHANVWRVAREVWLRSCRWPGRPGGGARRTT